MGGEHRWPRQRGFSMIEMLISVAIGLMVTATVLYTVSGSGVSGRKQNVQSTMHDLGNMALMQISDHLRMTGFWLPSSEVIAEDVSFGDGSSLFGCRGAFDDDSAVWDALACKHAQTTNANDALALRFQVQPGGRNWDCLGNVVYTQEMEAYDKAHLDQKVNGNSRERHSIGREIQEKFYIRSSGTRTGNPGLYCRSNVTPVEHGVPSEQLLMDNVDQLRIRYGVSPINPALHSANTAFDAPILIGRTARYREAQDMKKECRVGSITDNAWCAVDSIRICVVMRSDNNVNDEAGTPYVDCDGKVQSVNDRRLRQAFSMTVAIRNKIGVAP